LSHASRVATAERTKQDTEAHKLCKRGEEHFFAQRSKFPARVATQVAHSLDCGFQAPCKRPSSHELVLDRYVPFTARPKPRGGKLTHDTCKDQ